MFGGSFLLFIVQTVSAVAIYILWLRCILQKSGVSRQNVVMAWVFRVTQPVVQWFQKISPMWRGWDFGVVVPLCLVALVEALILWLMSGLDVATMAFIPLWTVLLLATRLLDFYFIVILMVAFLGWFPLLQGSPIYHVLKKISDPLLRPVRRILPKTGRFDWSLLIVLVVLKLIDVMVLAPGMPL